MKEWLTPAEIAAERLPGLPATPQGVNKLAAREQWNESLAYARRRAGLGGGTEYHVALLPSHARLAYESRHRAVVALVPKSPPKPANDHPAVLSERAAQERDARLAICEHFERFAAGQRWSQTSCVQFFVDKYNARSIKIDDWIVDLIPRLSKRSLARWRAEKAAGGAQRLAVDRSAARAGKGTIETANDGAVRSFVLALIAHQPHISAKSVRKLIRSEFGEELMARGGELVAVPPVRTIQHAMKALRASHTVALMRMTNPDKYRSTMAPAGVGSLRHIDQPNALWMIDASPVDALCVDGRHTIYACIDIATRRTILYVSRTPRASAVGLLIRKAVLAWGVPDKIKTDNGSDFVATSTKRLFGALGVEMELSDAYQPQQKGHVERVIRTFQHEVGPLLPGFVGHSVADRKTIEDRKSFADRLSADTADLFAVSLTGDKLQAYADEWVGTVYAHAAHGGLKGKSPAQAAREATRSIRIVDERALDVLLMPVAGKDGYRTVTKLGVRVEHHHYIVNACLPGAEVLVRMDPNDVGRVVCFDRHAGHYLGDGICPELAGIHPSTVLKAKREMQAEMIAAQNREAKAMIKTLTTGRPLIERVLEVAARDVPNVVALPKRQETHSTPAIEAALEASRPAHAESPPAPSAAAEVVRARVAADLAIDGPAPSPAPTPLRKFETPQLRYRRAVALEARLADGEAVPPDEAIWLGGYQTGPEYRALRKMEEDFGSIPG